MASIPMRSLLFTPANRPDFIKKLAASDPDVGVVDLEDAVAVPDKAAARDAARAAIEGVLSAGWRTRIFVRINAIGTPWFEPDLDGLPEGIAGVVVPKLEHAAQLAELFAALDQRGVGGLGIIGGIETAAGVLHAEELTRQPLSAVYFGAEDLIADIGGHRTVEGREIAYARAHVALAARASRIEALDMVVVDFSDDARFVREANEARDMGYAGKLCIHPRQVPLANTAFSPSSEEIDYSRRVLSAYDDAVAQGRGVIELDGQMVDAPMVTMAKMVLSRAAVNHE